MCCGTFGEGCHCVLSFFTVQHQNSSGQGIPYLVSIMRETWLESRDLHVLSLLRSRSKQSHSRHESSARQPIRPRGQQHWASSVRGWGTEGMEGALQPGSQQDPQWSLLLPASSLVPTHSPKLVPQHPQQS